MMNLLSEDVFMKRYRCFLNIQVEHMFFVGPVMISKLRFRMDSWKIYPYTLPKSFKWNLQSSSSINGLRQTIKP